MPSFEDEILITETRGNVKDILPEDW